VAGLPARRQGQPAHHRSSAHSGLLISNVLRLSGAGVTAALASISNPPHNESASCHICLSRSRFHASNGSVRGVLHFRAPYRDISKEAGSQCRPHRTCVEVEGNDSDAYAPEGAAPLPYSPGRACKYQLPRPNAEKMCIHFQPRPSCGSSGIWTGTGYWGSIEPVAFGPRRKRNGLSVCTARDYASQGVYR